MTETFSSSTDRRDVAPRIENAPDALQIDRIDDVVGLGAELDEAYKAEHKKASPRDLAVNRHHAINRMLAERGIEFGDSKNEKADYDLAYSTYESAMAHDQNTWLYLSEEDDTLRPRDVVFRNVLQHYAGRPAPSTVEAETADSAAESVALTDAAPATTDEKDSAAADSTSDSQSSEKSGSSDKARSIVEDVGATHQDELSEYREEYAKLVAGRSKHLIETAKSRKAIDAAHEEVAAMISGVTNQMYFAMEADGVDEKTIISTIDTFIYEETDALVAKLEEHRVDEYNRSKPFMKKVYDKWKVWGDEGWKGNVKKGVVFAVPGAALGLVGGAVIGGGLATVAAVAGARSIGRNIAGSRLDAIANSQSDAQELSQELRDEQVGGIKEEGKSHYDTLELIDQRTTEYRKRNRNRAIAGTAIAVTAGLVFSRAGDAGNYIADKFSDGDWKLGNPFRAPGIDIDLFGDNDIDGIQDVDHDGILDYEDPDIDSDDIGSFDDRDGDGIRNGHDLTPDGVDAPELDRDGDGVRNWLDSQPDNPDVTGSDGPNAPEAPTGVNTPATPEISEAARYVVPNEGGFQTLKELNVPKDKWEAIWQDAGSKLNAQGKTYVMDDGRFGWSRDMRLTNSDIEILTKAAERHGVNL
jgi:hypothetical protein